MVDLLTGGSVAVVGMVALVGLGDALTVLACSPRSPNITIIC